MWSGLRDRGFTRERAAVRGRDARVGVAWPIGALARGQRNRRPGQRKRRPGHDGAWWN